MAFCQENSLGDEHGDGGRGVHDDDAGDDGDAGGKGSDEGGGVVEDDITLPVAEVP